MTTARITTLLRTASVLTLLCVGLAACQSPSNNDPMQQPITAASEQQLLESLAQMKQALPDNDYRQLLQAVATLRTYDLEAISIEQHLASLDGQTPQQLVAAAEQLARKQPAIARH